MVGRMDEENGNPTETTGSPANTRGTLVGSNLLASVRNVTVMI